MFCKTYWALKEYRKNLGENQNTANMHLEKDNNKLKIKIKLNRKEKKERERTCSNRKKRSQIVHADETLMNCVSLLLSFFAQ